jgi:amino-acid N-acetyltransferase
MTNISIRPATEQDDATIKQMVSKEHLDPTSVKWQHFLIAERDEGDGSPRMVGIGQVKEYPGCQELGSLVVLPEYRRQGIAAELIRALEARAGRPLYLTCRSTMQHYYAGFGYERISIWKAPRAILWKLLFTRLFLVFGIQIVLMVKA